MKIGAILILILMLFSSKTARSQNVLDGVYIREVIVRNGDTLSTKIHGKVIDIRTLAPLAGIKVSYFASNGQNIGVLTDENGKFSFVNLYADEVSAKISCSDSLYQTKVWEFNTFGISSPREFFINFELVKKQ
ncbi:MAG TPA: hypothetical protein PKD91_01250 [Bacteroidia bacterium]|nr:hypothetical protein [Bacteroidia bacterium]